jgi:hypothetical protein
VQPLVHDARYFEQTRYRRKAGAEGLPSQNQGLVD